MTNEPPTAPAGLPRWVKITGIVVALLVVVVVVMLLTGNHGPQRHGARPAAFLVT